MTDSNYKTAAELVTNISYDDLCAVLKTKKAEELQRQLEIFGNELSAIFRTFNKLEALGADCIKFDDEFISDFNRLSAFVGATGVSNVGPSASKLKPAGVRGPKGKKVIDAINTVIIQAGETGASAQEILFTVVGDRWNADEVLSALKGKRLKGKGKQPWWQVINERYFKV